MNLVDGKIFSTLECDEVMNTLEERIISTLGAKKLESRVVINACEKLMRELNEPFYINAMKQLGIDETLGRSYLAEARHFFSASHLEMRLKKELGDKYHKPVTFLPTNKDYSVTEAIEPIGAILHIAAGNADALPAFSVLEGLLTGNINILKLPGIEGGISIALLLELIKIEPILKEYIYVFDYSSRDLFYIKKLVSLVDAVSVWGGVDAVRELRKIIPPNVKIIEWGHKVSFAYLTKAGINKQELIGLANNMIKTKQFLCSSCQGIFIDTEDMEQVYDFCQIFLPILEEVSLTHPENSKKEIRSQIALKTYTTKLEQRYSPVKIFEEEHAVILAYSDSVLEPAWGFGNPWVRPLPKQKILQTIRPYKNYLQTVGLICQPQERAELNTIFSKTGVVRTCSAENMSATFSGAAHDGEFPLRRYTKIMTIENPPLL